MTTMQFPDLTLGINPQAWAVAHLLNRYELDNSDRFHSQTAPWYNGRERGLCFMVGKYSGPVLCIAVFENRNSDSICALRWVRDHFGINPPTIESAGKLAYPDNKSSSVDYSVGPSETSAIAVWIHTEFQNFIEEQKGT